ncbi:MAG: hypothetical protein ACK55Z_32335, partial [bacterium]
MRGPRRAARAAHEVGECIGGDETCRDGVLEVVADVCDAIRPRDDFTLRCHRSGARPRVIADAIEGLHAQVERCEG